MTRTLTWKRSLEMHWLWSVTARSGPSSSSLSNNGLMSTAIGGRRHIPGFANESSWYLLIIQFWWSPGRMTFLDDPTFRWSPSSPSVMIIWAWGFSSCSLNAGSVSLRWLAGSDRNVSQSWRGWGRRWAPQMRTSCKWVSFGHKSGSKRRGRRAREDKAWKCSSESVTRR